MGWFKSTERMPAYGVEVLAITFKVVEPWAVGLVFGESGWRHTDTNERFREPVKYWIWLPTEIPLPPLPEDG